ncbi:LysM peptidoglycan-binding domain-containing protein [Paeniglutamicibacter antarcticus]|uniref:LysM peptidoglycan-binding domain-containing protein n=1 Tax=Arthrobacter terrae TaxID=2935737 RepID=A0A931CJ25_9MICC|nr:Gmad2 immunoglobulin-like domain-containing protein [Arthrobacter terrae]MBG0737942.1 LysM peptidoglycan-binding domain-containing protein [Arthrobacter terrae]
MAPRLIEVRQPRQDDLVGNEFVIAGFGTGFEAVVLWRVLDGDGQPIGEGNIQGAGSMGVIRDFGNTVVLENTPARGEHVTLQVFGDDPSGIRPPGPDLNIVRVTLFTSLQGFKLYEVKSGDNLTKIAQQEGQNTTANDIFEANRDRITNPNVIFAGQVLRIPLIA